MQGTHSRTFSYHRAFASRFLKDERDLIVYLPPDYADATERAYPVLYMHDGQNLFDPETAFLGTPWGLGDVAEELIASGQIEPIIIVGIYNAGAKRMAEYTPVRDHRGRGGLARAYARAVVKEIKPLIDGEYRTRPEGTNTALGGSSLGGLATLYMGLEYPEVFGKLIVMSPSVWWAGRDILKQVEEHAHPVRQKIWLDVGTCEGSDPETCMRDARDLRDALIKKDWWLGQNMTFMEDCGAGHNEAAWGRRIRDALLFLFPVYEA